MPEPVRAAIYCRMSLAIMNDTTKVDDQERIGRGVAAHRNWEVAGVYQDNNRSAWRADRKRPGWDRMLADVESGKITAIVVYHGDRLIRQPDDLGALLKLADGKGVKLASPTGTRDLGNPDDRFVLYIEAAMAMRESDNTSRRRKAQYERWRREGRTRPGGRGGRAYGFASDGVTHIGEEGAIIREAAVRVLAGEPTLAICRDINARGARMPTGRPFDHGALRKMLMRPRLAGLMPDGVHEGAWPPVLDRQTWEAVCAALAARTAGHGYVTNARRYLLSGIAKCGAPGCGSGLMIKTENRPGKTPGYRCVRPGCRKVQRSTELLDEYVITRVLLKLGDPGNPPGRVPQNTALAAEFRALTRQRAETEAAITDHAKGGALPLLLRRLESVDGRLAELRELAAGDARSRLLGAHTGMTREEFDALPLATRRALVSACFTVTVLPASRRGPGFNTEDVRLGTP